MKNTVSYLTIILFVALGVVGISIIYIYTQPTESLPLYEPAQSIASPSTTESTTLAAERAKSTTHSINVTLGSSDSSYTGSTGNTGSTGSTSSTGSKSSYTGSTSYSTNHYSGSTKSSTSSYSTRKSTSSKSNPYAAYDAGYEDVYDNDDYDLDRYNSDRDYANGVDDAMEDMEDGDW